MLLARVYEVLPLLCSGHRAKRGRGAELRILAFLTDPPVVSTILLHVDLPHRPPLIAPARAPPQADFLFDQTPVFDPLGIDPGPDLEFDQSLPPGLDD